MSAGRARLGPALAVVTAALAPAATGCIDTAPTARGDDPPADAAASSPEVIERAVEVVLHRPQAVFLLDVSASMSVPFGGQGPVGEEGPTRHEALTQALTDMLDEFAEADLGAVFFDNEVVETIAVGPGASEQLQARLEAVRPRGGTLFAPPLAAASALFAAAPPAARFVLFATDGSPNLPEDVGRGEVERLRAAGVTIFSLFLGRDDDENARALLLSLSGPMDRAADPRFAAQAADPAALARALADFATWVRDGACRFTLPDDAPAAEAAEAFLRFADLETSLLLVPAEALHDQPDPVFAPVPDTATDRDFALSWAACVPVVRDGAELVLRWSPDPRGP